MRNPTTHTLPAAALALLIGGLLGLAAPPAAAQVQMTTRADGVKVIFNEPGTRRTRRPARPRAPRPDLDLAVLIERHSARQGLDSALVQAVVQAESGYDPRARSRKGAMGLMQLMPATARELAVADPWDPDDNVRGGTAYLRRMLDRFGRLDLALAAYNAGPEAVERHGGVPPYPETRAYVARVLRLLGREAAVPAPSSPSSPKLYLVRRPGRRPMLTTDIP